MKQYLDIARKCLQEGTRKENRTGVATIGYHNDMAKYDLSEGFPAVTTKQLYFKQVVAEMLGFLRGYDNAKDFRELGCRVWDSNANENKQWLNNPYRKGTDDLGRIYGVQGRNFNGVDQLVKVYEDLRQGIDNRREIISYWNPAELDQMALPPCHMMHQFGIQNGDTLHLAMYQRSCDVPLGVPFNVAGYAWLLSVMAHITGLKVGTFTHFMSDIHIYENQVEPMKEQLKRSPKELPKLWINPNIRCLNDLLEWATVEDFKLVDYYPDSAISFPFAV